MPVPVIVPLYAAILALFFVFLSVRVIRARGTARVAIGTGGDRTLERVQRVHANFGEYVPFALLLIAFMEMHRWSTLLLHLLCLVLLFGRIVHAFGVSQEPENLRFRVAGMVMTLLVIAVAALGLLWDAFLLLSIR